VPVVAGPVGGVVSGRRVLDGPVALGLLWRRFGRDGGAVPVAGAQGVEGLLGPAAGARGEDLVARGLGGGLDPGLGLGLDMTGRVRLCERRRECEERESEQGSGEE
jgi:hypothetical protein